MSRPAIRISGLCPRCDGLLVRRINARDRTAFLGCFSYPQCRFTETIEDCLDEIHDEICDLKQQLELAKREAYDLRRAAKVAAPASSGFDRHEFRELVAVAHPDRWSQGQPASDLANELMKTVNRLRASN